MWPSWEMHMLERERGALSLELADGSSVQGFLCEVHAAAGAKDISRFGGWRRYIASLQQ